MDCKEADNNKASKKKKAHQSPLKIKIKIPNNKQNSISPPKKKKTNKNDVNNKNKVKKNNDNTNKKTAKKKSNNKKGKNNNKKKDRPNASKSNNKKQKKNSSIQKCSNPSTQQLSNSTTGPVVRLIVGKDINKTNSKQKKSPNKNNENNSDDDDDELEINQIYNRFKYSIVNKPKDELQQSSSTKNSLQFLMNNIKKSNKFNSLPTKIKNNQLSSKNVNHSMLNAKSRRLNEAKIQIAHAGNEDRIDNWLCILCQMKTNDAKLGFLYGPYYWKNNHSNKVENGINLPTELWIHEDCYVWTMPIASPNHPFNQFNMEVLYKALRSQCYICKKNGATLSCSIYPCRQSSAKMVHYPCAVQTGYHFHEDDFSIYCPEHLENYYFPSGTVNC